MPRFASRRKQQGIALLVLLMVVVLSGVFVLVNAMNKSGADRALERNRKTQAALDRAKQALLTYAATLGAESSMASVLHSPNRGVPGYLPCPDLGANEGNQAPNCGASSVSAIGRLPWQTLGLEPLKDGNGECLWYAVSGTYKNYVNGVNTFTANMMNWDTPGLFDVFAADGTTFLAGGSPSARAVAVIFSPGAVIKRVAALLPQDRSIAAGTSNCGGNYNALAYLDVGASGIDNSAVSAGASAVTPFIAGRASDTFNDRLVYITRDELWTAIKKLPDPLGVYPSLLQARLNTLTLKAAQCIAQYGQHNGGAPPDKRLTWATDLTAPNSNYDVDTLYDDVSPKLSGRIPYLVDTSRAQTINTLSGPPYYLFAGASYCSTSGLLDDHDINWYSNWKDHLFYALANGYRPAAGTPTSSCISSACLKINGGSTLYAGVVIFAGERLPTQVRDTNTDRADITNYLEGNNTSSNSSGNNSYQTGPATATFNDIVYCIQPTATLPVVGGPWPLSCPP